MKDETKRADGDERDVADEGNDAGDGDGGEISPRDRPWPWQGLVGRDVVIDTDGGYVYVGRLEAADDHFVAMSTVDVHDMRDSRATKEVYVREALKYGVRANRKLVYVARGRVMSVSPLEDVVRY